MKILIDNGHGIETLGKRSPDGRLKEYAYTREVADRVVKTLTAAGIDAVRIVPEDADVPLSERCTRANALYTESGKQAILVSIHCNAAGNGSAWMSAHGWSVFVDPTASQNSKRLATALADVAESKGVTVRKQAGGRNYWIQNLYICKHTRCPAVLTENFFQDNKEDVDFLLSEKGKQCVTDITVEGIPSRRICHSPVMSIRIFNPLNFFAGRIILWTNGEKTVKSIWMPGYKRRIAASGGHE